MRRAGTSQLVRNASGASLRYGDDQPVAGALLDPELADEFRDLVYGRAIVVGPADIDLPRADAIVAGMRHWDAGQIAKAVRLRVISRVGVGYDTVDIAAATAAGVVVCYAPQAPTVSTAEQTLTRQLSSPSIDECSCRSRSIPTWCGDTRSIIT